MAVPSWSYMMSHSLLNVCRSVKMVTGSEVLKTLDFMATSDDFSFSHTSCNTLNMQRRPENQTVGSLVHGLG